MSKSTVHIICGVEEKMCIVTRDTTIWVNTILRIALKNIAIYCLKNIAIYCCIAIFGLGPLVMLKCYTIQQIALVSCGVHPPVKSCL